MSYSPHTSAVSPMRDRARVLVIDDDPSFRNLLSAVLRTKYLIAVASDGLTGLQKLKEHPPDLVIIDVQMPGLDGLQTLTAIRKDPDFSHLWVIMLTGDASRETVLAAVQAGADDYLIKTAFSKDEVVRKIDRLLQRERGSGKPVAPATPSAQGIAARAPATSAPALHPAPSARGLATTAGTGIAPNPESGEILTQAVTGDGNASNASADHSHLQEILDSWD